MVVVRMYVGCMDGWMDVWMDRLDGWMGGRMGGCISLCGFFMTCRVLATPAARPPSYLIWCALPPVSAARSLSYRFLHAASFVMVATRHDAVFPTCSGHDCNACAAVFTTCVSLTESASSRSLQSSLPLTFSSSHCNDTSPYA